MTNSTVSTLIGRSNRLGSDPRNTNYADGNTSAKGTAVDPVTSDDVQLVWAKGSDGDLGTLTAVEATAIGNIVVQARSVGVIGGDRWHARELIRRTHPVTQFLPWNGVPATL
jgi:hypothetical protein